MREIRARKKVDGEGNIKIKNGRKKLKCNIV